MTRTVLFAGLVFALVVAAGCARPRPTALRSRSSGWCLPDEVDLVIAGFNDFRNLDGLAVSAIQAKDGEGRPLPWHIRFADSKMNAVMILEVEAVEAREPIEVHGHLDYRGRKHVLTAAWVRDNKLTGRPWRLVSCEITPTE